ncbi:hypothetical protein AYO20_06928 [Fonsecaea nubica]|uniref:FAD/NAD(P)-binding domain-containing protein n=1 Tax=Fonsecaea nubica TaxID=856822 RepID=A0A178CX05_9EURO|nr:hypothetical protein AYO20_06928 [Fonsecaea nubica]OAL33752.1 hypothetical protein AYO20_06928 [Fonsecaea nubica]
MAITNGVTSEPPTGNVPNLTTDVLIVGAGFGGIYGLYQFRKLNLSVKIVDAGTYYGGTWHHNRYPGARVDSEVPYYALSIPELWNTWTWSERFPGHEELRRYFAHADKVLELSKDTFFNTSVVEARFNIDTQQWTVKTHNGGVVKATYLVLAAGSSYKTHVPDFKNFSAYKGRVFHSSAWPKEEIDLSGKAVGVIGNGATGVQIVQTLARQPCKLTTFIRTPNIALPMRQRQLTFDEQDIAKSFYESWYQTARNTDSGFPFNTIKNSIWDVSPEERERVFEELWGRGGFNFSVGNYRDFLTDKKANALFYDFWARKVRARIQDPFKRDVVAPLEQTQYFCTKRPSLEQDYYEALDQPNVTVVNLNKTPIVEFVENGIRTTEKVHEFDIIVMATGFNAVTGSLTEIDLYDTDGKTVKEKWQEGVYTYLGLTIPKMPNLFMVYSPQAPTAFVNGPPVIEIQMEWIVDAVKKMREEEIKSITPNFDAAEKWRDEIQKMNEKTLHIYSDSWYMGSNIPGKKREQLLYMGGLKTYNNVIRDSLDGWKGFTVTKA